MSGTDVLDRRQLLRSGSLLVGSVWVAPSVTVLSLASEAAASTSAPGDGGGEAGGDSGGGDGGSGTVCVSPSARSEAVALSGATAEVLAAQASQEGEGESRSSGGVEQEVMAGGLVLTVVPGSSTADAVVPDGTTASATATSRVATLRISGPAVGTVLVTGIRSTSTARITSAGGETEFEAEAQVTVAGQSVDVPSGGYEAGPLRLELGTGEERATAGAAHAGGSALRVFLDGVLLLALARSAADAVGGACTPAP